MGISFAGFKCQQLITATAYTVVGVMNKMLTVTINVMIWDKHASGIGIASLCGALATSTSPCLASPEMILLASSQSVCWVAHFTSKHLHAHLPFWTSEAHTRS